MWNILLQMSFYYRHDNAFIRALQIAVAIKGGNHICDMRWVFVLFQLQDQLQNSLSESKAGVTVKMCETSAQNLRSSIRDSQRHLRDGGNTKPASVLFQIPIGIMGNPCSATQTTNICFLIIQICATTRRLNLNIPKSLFFMRALKEAQDLVMSWDSAIECNRYYD